MELSVSILNANDKKQMIKLLNNTDISYIHLDVMDGIFVENNSLPVCEIIELSEMSKKKLDVHLMVENPLEYIEYIKDISNIEYITIHLELNRDIKTILSTIKNYGFKVGLSIKPNTDITALLPYLKDIDLVLLMTVEPGLGGQTFIEDSKIRLKELKKTINDDIKIEVDGGINNLTIKDVHDADIAVVGSYIVTSDKPIDKINSLLV